MQDELETLATDLPITIIGVNEAGYESGNPLISNSGELAMLQDVADVNVWDSWAVTYRDVVIIGPDGKQVGVYNLTQNNLNNAAAYDELRALLSEAATLP